MNTPVTVHITDDFMHDMRMIYVVAHCHNPQTHDDHRHVLYQDSETNRWSWVSAGPGAEMPRTVVLVGAKSLDLVTLQRTLTQLRVDTLAAGEPCPTPTTEGSS